MRRCSQSRNRESDEALAMPARRIVYSSVRFSAHTETRFQTSLRARPARCARARAFARNEPNLNRSRWGKYEICHLKMYGKKMRQKTRKCTKSQSRLRDCWVRRPPVLTPLSSQARALKPRQRSPTALVRNGRKEERKKKEGGECTDGGSLSLFTWTHWSWRAECRSGVASRA